MLSSDGIQGIPSLVDGRLGGFAGSIDLIPRGSNRQARTSRVVVPLDDGKMRSRIGAQAGRSTPVVRWIWPPDGN